MEMGKGYSPGNGKEPQAVEATLPANTLRRETTQYEVDFIRVIDEAIVSRNDQHVADFFGKRYHHPLSQEVLDSALCELIEAGMCRASILLMGRGASPDAAKDRGAYTSVLGRLLEKGASQEDLKEEFWRSAAKGCRSVMEFFSSADEAQELGKSIRRAMREAVLFDHPEIVELLLDRLCGGMLPSELSYSLSAAAKEGSEKVVKFFLDRGISPDLMPEEGGSPAILEAASNGHVGIVERLIEAGAGVNEVKIYGGTAPLLSESTRRCVHSPEAIRAIIQCERYEAHKDAERWACTNAMEAGVPLSVKYVIEHGLAHESLNFSPEFMDDCHTGFHFHYFRELWQTLQYVHWLHDREGKEAAVRWLKEEFAPGIGEDANVGDAFDGVDWRRWPIVRILSSSVFIGCSLFKHHANTFSYHGPDHRDPEREIGRELFRRTLSEMLGTAAFSWNEYADRLDEGIAEQHDSLKLMVKEVGEIFIVPTSKSDVVLDARRVLETVQFICDGKSALDILEVGQKWREASQAILRELAPFREVRRWEALFPDLLLDGGRAVSCLGATKFLKWVAGVPRGYAEAELRSSVDRGESHILMIEQMNGQGRGEPCWVILSGKSNVDMEVDPENTIRFLVNDQYEVFSVVGFCEPSRSRNAEGTIDGLLDSGNMEAFESLKRLAEQGRIALNPRRGLTALGKAEDAGEFRKVSGNVFAAGYPLDQAESFDRYNEMMRRCNDSVVGSCSAQAGADDGETHDSRKALFSSSVQAELLTKARERLPRDGRWEESWRYYEESRYWYRGVRDQLPEPYRGDLAGIICWE